MNKKLFYLNAPAEYTRDNTTGIFIPVEATRFCGRTINTEIIGVDTILLLRINNWAKIYELAQKLAAKKFAEKDREGVEVEEEPSEEFYLNEIAI